eukprot:1093647-Amorphochlora_amoeboformis.AAC.1
MGSGGRKEVSDYRKKLSIIIHHNPNGQQSISDNYHATAPSESIALHTTGGPDRTTELLH